MEDSEHPLSSLGHFDMNADLSTQMVSVENVLLMCTYLGKELQGIPKAARKASVTRVLNKSHAMKDQGFTLGAVMLSVFANSWDDFQR